MENQRVVLILVTNLENANGRPNIFHHTLEKRLLKQESELRKFKVVKLPLIA